MSVPQAILMFVPAAFPSLLDVALAEFADNARQSCASHIRFSSLLALVADSAATRTVGQFPPSSNFGSHASRGPAGIKCECRGQTDLNRALCGPIFLHSADENGLVMPCLTLSKES